MNINELHKQYFDYLGDLAYICFYVYMRALDNGECKVILPDGEGGEFNISKLIQNNKYCSPLKEFITSLSQFIDQSWQTFLDSDEGDIPYINKLWSDADELRRQLVSEGVSGIQNDLSTEIIGGFVSGGDTITHMLLLEQLFPNIRTVSKLGKITQVAIECLPDAQSGIGIKTAESVVRPFSLFNPNLSLNDDRLVEYGLGSAIGCPASRLPSQACREFLSETFVVQKITPFFRHYYEWLKPLFTSHVLEPFNVLKENYPEFVDRVYRKIEGDLLCGKVPQELLEFISPELLADVNDSQRKK